MSMRRLYLELKSVDGTDIEASLNFFMKSPNDIFGCVEYFNCGMKAGPVCENPEATPASNKKMNSVLIYLRYLFKKKLHNKNKKIFAPLHSSRLCVKKALKVSRKGAKVAKDFDDR